MHFYDAHLFQNIVVLVSGSQRVGGGSLEPIILKAWSPGAQTIPLMFFSNFSGWSIWCPKKHAVEPWSTAILPLGARSPLKYVLEIRSPRSLGSLVRIFLQAAARRKEDPGQEED